MASPTQRTWVWVDSGSWWWTGRPGMLWFMGCKESDMTERLDWTELLTCGYIGSLLLLCGLSLVAASGSYSLSGCGVRASHCRDFSCCGVLALGYKGRVVAAWGSTSQAQQLWLTALFAPRHGASSQTRDRTQVPCLGGWILIHWEVPRHVFKTVLSGKTLKSLSPWVALWEFHFLNCTFLFCSARIRPGVMLTKP